MKWQNLIIYLGISLFLISCGKKKESTQNQPVGESTEATPVPASESAPAPVNIEPLPDNKSGNIPGSDNRGRGAIINDRKKINPPSRSGRNNNSRNGSNNNSNRNSNFPTLPGNLATQNSSSMSVPLTDGVSNFGLFYTGSSGDGILEKLVTYARSKSQAEQKANKALAISIYDISYLVDRTGQLTIDMTLKYGNDIQKSRFQMPYQANQLMLLAHTPLLVTARCLDTYKYSDNCSNLLVGVEKNRAQTMAILRQSKAILTYNLVRKQDAEQAELFQFFNNTKLDYETPNKVDQIYLSTYEVVGGKSGYTAVIMGKGKQVISLSSNLLVKKDLTPSRNEVEKATDWDDLYLYMTRFGKDLRFMNMFKSGLLTENNGKGKITIEATFESKVTKVKNNIKLEFARTEIPAQL